MKEILPTNEVFTPGRQPSWTYNPRSDQEFEGTFKRFLQMPGFALAMSGPTKSGKTVLASKMAPPGEAIWISGSEIQSLDSLWDKIIDQLNLYTELEVTAGASKDLGGGLKGSVGLPGLGQAEVSLTHAAGNSSETVRRVKRDKSSVAQEALRLLQPVVVIDDFHYVPAGLVQSLTRTIKQLIPMCPVLLIAVPQSTFAAVRAETEMGGRVMHLEIKPWSVDELQYIAEKGFEKLNLLGAESIGLEFAKQSLGAPFLMQQLCLEFCLENDVLRAVWPPRDAPKLADRDLFLRKLASRTEPGVFALLRKGPRTKGTARIARVLRDGRQTDIYGAILYAVSRMGPVRQIPLSHLLEKMRELFEEPPRTQNVTSALSQMKEIAHSNREGSDPALDFKDDVLYIADPFLSFFLRFGEWELPQLPEDAI